MLCVILVHCKFFNGLCASGTDIGTVIVVRAGGGGGGGGGGGDDIGGGGGDGGGDDVGGDLWTVNVDASIATGVSSEVMSLDPVDISNEERSA